MARKSNRLTVVGLRKLPRGKHADGNGLYLLKTSPECGRWMLRYRQFGRRRDMGLGGWPAVGLADARRNAQVAHDQIRNNVDPIAMRREQHRAHLHLLSEIAMDCFESRKSQLRNEGADGRWFSPLELHVLPKLGSTPVTQIRQVLIRDTLAQLWRDKPVTAEKALERLGLVLKHAAALGLEVDLQATMKARLLLGKTRRTVKHIPAPHWKDVPEFYDAMTEPTLPHLALKLLILTGIRSGPLRHARTDQFDLEQGIWTIPADVMKGRVGADSEFRVPLSRQAVGIIQETTHLFSNTNFLFAGPRGNQISDMTLLMYMKRRGLDARPHGFRTSLRVWLAEQTGAPHEVAETVLAHTSGSKVVRAYRRTDFLEQRRQLMQQWADYVVPTSTSRLVAGRSDVRLSSEVTAEAA